MWDVRVGGKRGYALMKIYVASSWRNTLQRTIVALLRQYGHDVYDFRHPEPGSSGFNWREIDANWQHWAPEEYRQALEHPIVKHGFHIDMTALRQCEVCVLVLPSGRSASFEFGWAVGAGKRGAIVMFEACEPELMYSGQPILTTIDELCAWALESTSSA